MFPAGGGGAAAQLLVQVAAILVLARLLTPLARHVGQPPVMAEILVGVLLGPSLLGRMAPAAAEALFPAHSLDALAMAGTVGVLLFLFEAGLHVDGSLLRGRGRAAAGVTVAEILLPFALGVAAVPLLRHEAGPARPGTVPFALFLGTAMAVTALPVLARILRECGLDRTALGTLALVTAAASDAVAWCLLTVAVAATRAGGFAGALFTLAGAAALSLAALAVVRPALDRLARDRDHRPGDGRAAETDGRPAPAPGAGGDLPLPRRWWAVAVSAAPLPLFAWAAHAIGLHAVFGAFLAGLAVPRRGGVAARAGSLAARASAWGLLPLFFAHSGLRTRIDLLDSAAAWGLAAVVLALACAGKILGASVAARVAGMAPRESLVLGVLLNTRGLMELVVLNVGLDLGVISERLFTILVVMTLVTTLATPPLLRILRAREVAGAAPG